MRIQDQGDQMTTTMIHTKISVTTAQAVKTIATMRGLHANVVYNELLTAALKGTTMAKAKKAVKKTAKKTVKAYGKK